jgi:chromosome partitioning protein
MAHIICIVSQKGGTGKTTTAVNLAGSLALLEKKTLLIDCDPLGNATTGVGIDKSRLSRNLYHAIIGQVGLHEVIVPTELEFLKVAPAEFELLRAERKLAFVPNREERLRHLLETVHPGFDYVIIDSPPSLNYLARSAMVSSDWLLIPIQCQIYTLEGLGQLLRTAREIQDVFATGLRIAGVLFTMCEGNGSGATACAGTLLSSFQENIFKSTIPWDRLLRESSDFGRPLVLHDITAGGARAYLDLTLELVRFFEKTTTGKRDGL